MDEDMIFHTGPVCYTHINTTQTHGPDPQAKIFLRVSQAGHNRECETFTSYSHNFQPSGKHKIYICKCECQFIQVRALEERQLLNHSP